MDTEIKEKEQTILDRVDELWELLRLLNLGIDNLVARNPIPEEPDKAVSLRETNVFDEIINTLTVCRGLTREATEKIEAGISQKVR